MGGNQKNNLVSDGTGSGVDSSTSGVDGSAGGVVNSSAGRGDNLVHASLALAGQRRKDRAAVLATFGISGHIPAVAFGAVTDGEVPACDAQQRDDNAEVDDDADDDEGDQSVDEVSVVEGGLLDGEAQAVGGVLRTDEAEQRSDERGDEGINQHLEGSTDHDGDGQVDNIASQEEIFEACRVNTYVEISICANSC